MHASCPVSTSATLVHVRDHIVGVLMARWPRQILFGDVDAMYASAATVADPSLAGKLVAVGSPPPRGIVTAASYPARRFGVKAAMPTGHALRLCPNLILVSPDFGLYRRLHDHMRQVTDELFPASAWSSIDEFYADVTDLQSLHPTPTALGQKVKNAIFEATGLRCTIAIATGKIVAKVAADFHKPDGLAVIEPGTEAAFLAPKPVQALPGIGPKSATALQQVGIHVIEDLLDLRFEATLKRFWGSRLSAMQARAQGIDFEPVLTGRMQKSMGHETTFNVDTADYCFLQETLRGFLSDLAHEMRLDGLEAGGFTIKVKDCRFRVTTRCRRFPKPTNYDPEMWLHIQPVLESLVIPGTAYRLVGLSLAHLVPASLSLFDDRTSKAVAAMDRIIQKHGTGVMRLGGTPEK